MEISKIVIKNFKGIDCIEMNPIRPINVLIGRNNSGKSSILMCLQFLNQYFKALEPEDRRGVNPNIKVPTEYFRKGPDKTPEFGISITVAQSVAERKQKFDSMIENWNKNYNSIMDPISTNLQLEKDLFSTLTFNFFGKAPTGPFGLMSISTISDGHDITLAESQSPGVQMNMLPLHELFIRQGRNQNCLSIFELKNKMGFRPDCNIDYTYGGLTSKCYILHNGLIFTVFNHIKERFNSTFLLSPYRHGKSVDAARMCTMIHDDASDLVNYIHNLNLNKYTVFQNIANFVKRIAPEVGRLHPRFVGKEGSNLELAYEWADGNTVNLENMGGGIEQLLVLGCILIQQRTKCILWEEPESHLHPGAQDVLLNELEKLVGNSTVFLTTHSPVFIRPSERIAVHVIRNTDGKSATGITLTEDNLREAATMIGSRPGHLAQADIVVYVEGKRGADAVEEWLDKWPDKKKTLRHLLLLVQPINPDEMGTEDFQLDGLKRITPNMIIFVDKDNEAGSNEPKKARKVLMDKCQKEVIPCIITEKRKVEDYFTESAVKQTLPSNLLKGWAYDPEKPMGEQFESGWKRYNRSIAAAMDWKDIENHKDVMKIFDEIGNYAGRLMPASEH